MGSGGVEHAGCVQLAEPDVRQALAGERRRPWCWRRRPLAGVGQLRDRRPPSTGDATVPTTAEPDAAEQTAGALDPVPIASIQNDRMRSRSRPRRPASCADVLDEPALQPGRVLHRLLAGTSPRGTAGRRRSRHATPRRRRGRAGTSRGRHAGRRRRRRCGRRGRARRRARQGRRPPLRRAVPAHRLARSATPAGSASAAGSSRAGGGSAAIRSASAWSAPPRACSTPYMWAPRSCAAAAVGPVVAADACRVGAPEQVDERRGDERGAVEQRRPVRRRRRRVRPRRPRRRG